MQARHKKAFTMLELIFVIVVIGILSAIAIPKFAATRGDAVMVKAKSTVSAVRSSVATERQKRILNGTFTPVTQLSSATGVANGRLVFDGFAGVTSNPALEYPVLACTATTSQECWYMPNAATYRFNLPTGGSVDFNLTRSRFICSTTDQNCLDLTQ